MWLKGTLHLHSTGSDGRTSIPELAELYRQHGYDFIAITDHNTVSGEPCRVKGINVIKGMEIGFNLIHAVGVGINNVPKIEIKEPADLSIIKQYAGFSFLCHPYWSNLDSSHFDLLKQFPAMEVYNSGCELEIARGNSAYFWDGALSAGICVNGLATDDSHQRLKDYCFGWVMVKTSKNTENDIINALNKGNYYSSTGPDIPEISVNDGKVKVATSPCKQVRFIANLYYGSVVNSGKAPLTSAEYQLCGREKYLRVECLDFEGRKAWSNPLYF